MCWLHTNIFDHARSANYLANYGFTIYASEGTIDSLKFDRKYNTTIAKSEEEFLVDDEWLVLPFKTEHDAKEPLGFFIKNTITEETILFITDSFYVEYSFPPATYILAECNYDSEYVEANKDDIPNYRRLIFSHMSYQNLLKFLDKTDLSQTKEIYLIHLSFRNSDAQKFKLGVTEATGKVVHVA